ncbi:TonB-dependent receptor [Sphingopyxis yananensis]|uniref:TonB-dependent receptor n=1 Tax=Sphingopyxis yananensis TaxID=2886687 RepID=UPI001D12824C|nr:TonB-dependent receptor [Sphingopyxis yananensis]MCC2603119.1 TonB-dependent receptor [Sphingopyxis yananensis]
MVNRKLELRALLFGCAATICTMPAAVSAQQADGVSPASDNHEIIVTATRRSESLKDVAMAINVATGEMLEKLAIFDAKDIQQLSPALEMTNTTGRNNTTTLRGIAFDPDQGTSPSVQIYFNEVPVDAQVAYTAIYDMQQVEVLRGPQGLLRGLSAPAGAITFTARRPSFDVVEGYAQATVTDLAGYNVQGGVSLPFSESVALRLAVLVDGNRLNHVRNVNRGGERSYGSTQSFRATVGLRPTDASEAYFTYQYLVADRNQYQQVIGAGNTPVYLEDFSGKNPDLLSGPALTANDYTAVSDGLFRNRLNSHLINANINYDFGGATLSFVGAHQYSTQTVQRDMDMANAVPGYISTSDVFIPMRINSGEVRLASNNDEGLAWNLGAFYRKQSGVTVVDEAADNFFAPVTVYGSYPYLPINAYIEVPVSDRTWSFNAGLRFKSGPLKIEGGLRYSLIHNVYTATVTASSPGIPGVPTAPPFNFTSPGVPAHLQLVKEKPFTGGINISYGVTPDINIYAAYGHSFRAGSAGVGSQPGWSDDLVQTKPEKTDSWEIGVKGSSFGRRLNFGLTGFYQKIDGYLSRFDQIYYNCPELNGACVPVGTPNATPPSSTPVSFFPFNYNADATIKGVELELNGRPTNNWDFGLNAAYIKARFNNANVPCNTLVAGVPVIQGTNNVSFCRRNGRLSDTPDFSLTANTEIRAPMGSVTPYLRALLNYRPSFTATRSDYRYRHRELLNLFVGVRSEDAGWDINVFVRNVLGQARVTNIGDNNMVENTLAGPFESGYRTVNVMAPREFGLTAAVKF